MFDWSPLYDVGVEIVDEQHHKLFEMINELAKDLERGSAGTDRLESALDSLLEYAYQHFVDEEKEMARYRVDQRHQSFQRMEHHSFIFDAKKMRSAWDDIDINDKFEKLLHFVTAWLVYHTLRTDQHLGIQIAAIKRGESPEAAYELLKTHQLDPKIYQKVVDALVSLWSEALERVGELEQQLKSVHGEE